MLAMLLLSMRAEMILPVRQHATRRSRAGISDETSCDAGGSKYEDLFEAEFRTRLIWLLFLLVGLSGPARSQTLRLRLLADSCSLLTRWRCNEQKHPDHRHDR